MSISESLLALAFALAMPSCTPGDACLRHSDCDKGLVCSEGTCARPPVETTAPDATSDAPTAEVGDASLDASDSSDASSDSELDTQDVSDSSVRDGNDDATDGAEPDAADADSAMDSLSDSFEVGG